MCAFPAYWSLLLASHLLFLSNYSTRWQEQSCGLTSTLYKQDLHLKQKHFFLLNITANKLFCSFLPSIYRMHKCSLIEAIWTCRSDSEKLSGDSGRIITTSILGWTAKKGSSGILKWPESSKSWHVWAFKAIRQGLLFMIHLVLHYEVFVNLCFKIYIFLSFFFF